MKQTEINNIRGKILLQTKYIFYVLLVSAFMLAIAGCGGGGGGGGAAGAAISGIPVVGTGSVTLQWDKPIYNSPYCINASGHNPDQISCEGAGGTWVTNDTLNPDVSTYIVYYGSSSENYTYSAEINNSTGTTISGLVPGELYIAVTAVNTIGNESEKSDELSVTIL